MNLDSSDGRAAQDEGGTGRGMACGLTHPAACVTVAFIPLAAILSFGGFYGSHFGSDTTSSWNPRIYFEFVSAAGRPLLGLIMWPLHSVGFDATSWSGWLSLLTAATVGLCALVVRKAIRFEVSGYGVDLACLSLFVQPLITGWFVFPEISHAMALALLAVVVGAMLLSRGRYAACVIVLTACCMIYQPATYGWFPLIVLVCIGRPRLWLKLSIGSALLGLAFLVDLVYIKMVHPALFDVPVRATGRMFENLLSFGDRDYLRTVLLELHGFAPRGEFFALALAPVAIGAFQLDGGVRRRFLSLVGLSWGAAFVLTFLPMIAEERLLLYLPPRITWVFGSLPAFSLCLLILLSEGVSRLAMAYGIALFAFNATAIAAGATANSAFNQLDRNDAYIVGQLIREMELEEGGRVKELGIVNDSAPRWRPPGAPARKGDCGKRNILAPWASVGLVNRYSKRRFVQIQVPPQVVEKAHAVNFHYLSRDNVILDGEKAYVIMY